MNEKLVTHHQDCHCEDCEDWFKVMTENYQFLNRGLCPRCKKAIDDHAFDAGIIACPVK